MQSKAVGRCFAVVSMPALVLGFVPTQSVFAQQRPRSGDYVSDEPAQRRHRAYLTQLSFVLEGARRILLFGEAHAAEPDLARFVHPLSEDYVQLASKMTPGDRLKMVHPHLVIVVENVERALHAAARGQLQSYRQHVRTIREELATLDAVLRHLKVRLPEPVR